MEERRLSPTPERRLGNYRNADLAELRHRFRAPVREIMTGAEILIEEASTLRNERALNLLRHIHSAALAALNDVGQALANRDDVEAGEVELLSAKIRPRVERILSSVEAIDGGAGVVPEEWLEDIERIADSARSLVRMLAAAPDHHGFEDTADIGGAAVEAGAPRVLVVGGETVERRVLCRRLERHGCAPVEAPDSATALDLAVAEAFDTMLLDLMMPAMSAFELLERMKADHRLRKLPIVAIAAFDETDRVVRALQMGADDYLLKPLEPAMLRTRINSQLERQRLREQVARLKNQYERTAEAD